MQPGNFRSAHVLSSSHDSSQTNRPHRSRRGAFLLRAVGKALIGSRNSAQSTGKQKQDPAPIRLFARWDLPHGNRLRSRILSGRRRPIRPVILGPFDIDVYPVTNQDFIHFVEATGYETESERFDWSLVFWMHLPPDQLEELVEDTVAAAPW